MAGREQDPACDVLSAIRLQFVRELVECYRGEWPSGTQRGPPLQLVLWHGGHALPPPGRQLGNQKNQRILPARQHDHQRPSHPGAGSQEGIDYWESGWDVMCV